MASNQKTTQENGSNVPDFIVYNIADRGKNQKAAWNRIGVAYFNQDGEGLNVYMNAMPFNFDGKLTLRAPLQDDSDGDEKYQK